MMVRRDRLNQLCLRLQKLGRPNFPLIIAVIAAFRIAEFLVKSADIPGASGKIDFGVLGLPAKNDRQWRFKWLTF